jgi:hypothetical protein
MNRSAEESRCLPGAQDTAPRGPAASNQGPPGQAR